MQDNYKSSKEEFVSGHSGSTITHINLISSVALSSIAFHSALKSRFPQNKYLNNLVTEFTILVLPLLLSMTVFATTPKPLILNGILIFPILPLLQLPLRSSLSPSSSPPVQLKSDQSENSETMHRGILVKPLPALTTYRSHMLVMTFLCILAVDFPVFPRTLAKCETFGVSLMDLGVGSFVFSQGVVSAIPLLKDPGHLSEPLLPKLAAVARKMLPLIVLGLLRVILVKGTEYPEHESEYGTHWNFFLTMAALPLLQVLLHPMIFYIHILFVGVAMTFLHQFALSFTYLQDWTLNAPRLNIISQNKEGLVSLPGYLAIHMLGLLIGTILLPSSLFDFRHLHRHIRHGGSATAPVYSSQLRSKHYDDTTTQLRALSVLGWASHNLLDLAGLGGGVSRRLANTPYVIWIVAFNTSFIAAYLAIENYFFPEPDHSRTSSESNRSSLPSGGSESPPEIVTPEPQLPEKAASLLEAINVNGLPLFLLANVVTGLVNLTIKTMYTSDFEAMTILSLYAFGVSAVAWLSKERQLWKILQEMLLG